MRKPLIAGLAVGALLALSSALPASAATGDATLSVLHAVPKVTVDVYLDGKRAIDNFTPGSLAGPMSVPAGQHTIAITAGDATDASKPIIGPVTVTLTAGGNYTAVAHDKANGDPTATLFTNDVSAIPAGEGRLIVRHTAAAPAVDVLAGGKAVISGLTNPGEKSLVLPAGTISASVAAAGTTTPVIGPANVNVANGADTIVYAWGSLTDKNLALATQTISGLGTGPNGVPAGNAGLVASNAPSGNGWIAAGVAGLVALAALSAVSVRRRATTRRSGAQR